MPGMDGWGGKDGVPNKEAEIKPVFEQRKLDNLLLHQEIAKALEPVILAAVPNHSLSDIRWAIKSQGDKMVDLLLKVKRSRLSEIYDYSDLRQYKESA